VEAVSAASVRGHIWVTSDSVNAFLQFYFRPAHKSQFSADLPPRADDNLGLAHGFSTPLSAFLAVNHPIHTPIQTTHGHPNGSQRTRFFTISR
jgi:hypothetical protein